jgi:DNA-binding transcriptional MerR regulator
VAFATDDKTQKRYRGGDAARLARMPVTTLRILERRYGVVAPPRSESGQRLHSEDGVRRLLLIKSLVQRGHPIGAIVKLDRIQLDELGLGRFGREFAEAASGAPEAWRRGQPRPRDVRVRARAHRARRTSHAAATR